LYEGKLAILVINYQHKMILGNMPCHNLDELLIKQEFPEKLSDGR
jgi:hypothetical protein